MLTPMVRSEAALKEQIRNGKRISPMDTNALKRFAQEARQSLRQSIRPSLPSFWQRTALPAVRANAPCANETRLRADGEDRVVEQVAYTWFSRFTALQFMDMNDYNRRGDRRRRREDPPEILADASAGVFDQAIIPENTSNMVRRCWTDARQAMIGK